MPGTREGGLKAAAKNKQLYGASYYQTIGAMGGRKSRGGGFNRDYIYPDGLTGSERASLAGKKSTDKRWGKNNSEKNGKLTATQKGRINKILDGIRKIGLTK